MIYDRPKKRRKSIIRIIQFWMKPDMRIHNLYMSRALVYMVRNSRKDEALALLPYCSEVGIDPEIIANLTFDFLKTSPVYNKDKHCFEFMDDNLIPYLEVDNTKIGTYTM